MSDQMYQRRRITLKQKCPNPLFEKWLREWKTDAVSKGSDMQYCFAKALASLKKYPLRLNSGKECGILQNFGTKLCLMLDQKLDEHRRNHPESENEPAKDQHFEEPGKQKVSSKPQKIQRSPIYQQKSPRKRRKKYVPAKGSAPYALLVTLLSSNDFMFKAELQSLAQPLCDKSFKKPALGSHFTAWSSMSTLIKKGFVTRSGCPAKYALTLEGETLAKELQTTHQEDTTKEVSNSIGLPGSSKELSSLIVSAPNGTNEKEQSSFIFNTQAFPSNMGKQQGLPDEQVCFQNAQGLETTWTFAPGNFDVILLVDTAETGGKRKAQVNECISYLERHKVPFEVRCLKVGDFVWVCRDKTTGSEALLPYIVERKRVDDFARSIMDGRFHEQKFRLKQTGVPNLIYLVESHGRNCHTVLPVKTLNQAAVNTQVVDGFTLKYTDNHQGSLAYLAMLTSLFKDLFQNKSIISCAKDDLPPFNLNEKVIALMTFQEFNKTSAKMKAFRVREMFMRQLLQLHGLSVEKAMAIVERYPTPRSLVAAYSEGAGENLLSTVSHGSLSRQIGPGLSKVIFDLYTKESLS